MTGSTPRSARRWPTMIALVAGVLLTAGCGAPEHEPPGEPPEPRATALRDGMQDPLDRADAVEAAVEAADARRRDGADGQNVGQKQ